jgi:hypothetical protein
LQLLTAGAVKGSNVRLKSLTYTSLARLDLTTRDLLAIHQSARRLNALDGITGLLIFNGTRFLQIIEGEEGAIDDLVERLRADRRHSALEIRDQRMVDTRSFPDWSMELVTVSAAYLDAREEIDNVLPDDLSPDIGALIRNMAKRIATPLPMPE